MVRMRIKAGFGYWDVTIYPYGGCFKRAIEPLEFAQFEVLSKYLDGSTKEFRGTLLDGRKVCVISEACERK